MKISQTRWDAASPNHKKTEDGQPYIWIASESRWEPVEEFTLVDISPIYGNLTVDAPWEGLCQTKPWEYEITAAIPCLNTSETLPICIELLRLQTNRPFILLIDTGSIPKLPTTRLCRRKLSARPFCHSCARLATTAPDRNLQRLHQED